MSTEPVQQVQLQMKLAVIISANWDFQIGKSTMICSYKVAKVTEFGIWNEPKMIMT